MNYVETAFNYGIKNTIVKLGIHNQKKVKFQDYNVPSEQLNNNNNLNDIMNKEGVGDDAMNNFNENAEDQFDILSLR